MQKLICGLVWLVEILISIAMGLGIVVYKDSCILIMALCWAAMMPVLIYWARRFFRDVDDIPTRQSMVRWNVGTSLVVLVLYFVFYVLFFRWIFSSFGALFNKTLYGMMFATFFAWIYIKIFEATSWHFSIKDIDMWKRHVRQRQIRM